MFSLSVLDLFSAAMCAFIFLSIILFPYYGKNSALKEKLDSAKGKIGSIQKELDSATSRMARCEKDFGKQEEELQGCLKAASTTFLAVVIDWHTAGYDVDLYVIDPERRVFFYEKNNRPGANGVPAHYPDTPAQLSVDNQTAGVEMWQHPAATSGIYCIGYALYSVSRENAGRPVPVKGRAFYRNGATALPDAVLSAASPRARIGAVVLASDGKLSFVPNDSRCPTEGAWQFRVGASASRGNRVD